MLKQQMNLPPGARVIQIPREEDRAFRKFLIDRCPESVRNKMREGLSSGPKRGGAAHAIRYFGADEVKAIGMRVAPLLEKLELQCPRLIAWLGATQFANDYRILKAFDDWAAIAATNPLILLDHGVVIVDGENR